MSQPLPQDVEEIVTLTQEEYFLVAKWRELSKWGTLEARKQNGALFEVTLSTVDRPRAENKL